MERLYKDDIGTFQNPVQGPVQGGKEDEPTRKADDVDDDPWSDDDDESSSENRSDYYQPLTCEILTEDEDEEDEDDEEGDDKNKQDGEDEEDVEFKPRSMSGFPEPAKSPKLKPVVAVGEDFELKDDDVDAIKALMSAMPMPEGGFPSWSSTLPFTVRQTQTQRQTKSATEQLDLEREVE